MRTESPVNRESGPRGIFLLIACLFFLSGSAGLVYQVLWMRTLGLFFGSDMYGVSIVLSTFMGGLALGSLAGGRLAQHTSRALLWYGAFEAGIGLFALRFDVILEFFEPLLSGVYPPQFEDPAWNYQVVRLALASGTLLIPTTLMGATLPLILKHFVRSSSILGQRAAFFYAVNTLGALAGTLIAGFVLLPRFGMSASTLCAAAINLTIGCVCIAIGWRAIAPAEAAPGSPGRIAEADTLPGLDHRTRMRVSRSALLAIGISGFGSFAFEVVWMRILLNSFSATVYSFASMLSCFLLGIFLGSLLVSRYVDRHPNPTRLFAQLELGVGACVAVLCLSINAVPDVFRQLLALSIALTPKSSGSALIFSTLSSSLVSLLIPTTLLGATFAVALRAYTTSVSQVGRRTGNLYASNTLGAILGSLTAGLVMIPAVGPRASLAMIALLFTAVGLALFWASRISSREPFVPRRVAVAAAMIVLIAGVGLSMPYRVTLNLNQRAGAQTELLYHAEGIQNTIDVVKSRSGVTSLIIGGNVEADDGYTQRRHFVLKGHLPLLFLEEPRTVLVIGLGMGITLAATARHEGVDRIDVVELSPEILEAQGELREINGDIAHNPLVRVKIDDGRNYVRMTEKRYDMITADPIHPKISRVGYLYTKEYYEAIRDRLAEGGVVCQWMPLYQISPRRLRSAMKTFVEVFPNATFWYVKNHGLFVAKLDSPLISYELLARKFEQPNVRNDLASIAIHSPEELLSLLLLAPEQVHAFIEEEPDVPMNTDDYPYLEYFVPSDLFYRPLDNVRELVKHLVDPTTLVKNQPAQSVQRVRELVSGRPDRLVEALAKSKPRATGTE